MTGGARAPVSRRPTEVSLTYKPTHPRNTPRPPVHCPVVGPGRSGPPPGPAGHLRIPVGRSQPPRPGGGHRCHRRDQVRTLLLLPHPLPLRPPPSLPTLRRDPTPRPGPRVGPRDRRLRPLPRAPPEGDVGSSRPAPGPVAPSVPDPPGVPRSCPAGPFRRSASRPTSSWPRRPRRRPRLRSGPGPDSTSTLCRTPVTGPVGVGSGAGRVSWPAGWRLGLESAP